MSTIRKQAITSGILLYAGFAVGALNIYLYTKNGGFAEGEFGLTRVFFDFGQNIFSFASLGTIAVLYKFYPYYKNNLAPKENDLLTWVFCASTIGFVLILITGLIFQPFMINYFGKSNGKQLLAEYYLWVFPFGLGMLFFAILEGFSWVLQKTVMPNFLKETGLRLFTTLLIALYYFKVIGFSWFIYLFSFLFFAIAAILLVYLIRLGAFNITFNISRVTKKFWKKMVWMQLLMFSGTVIAAVGQTIDGILIAGIKGLVAVEIFTLAQYLANLVQVPQRSLQSISVGVLVQAWKDKDEAEVFRVYKRSCINMLIMSLFIYGNVVLNAASAIVEFGLKENLLQGINAMIILGLVRIIDAGTGVNGMVILTSKYWRFDFYSNIVMIVLIIPCNYFLIKQVGIIGSAYAQLISFLVFNFIRFEFIRRKFQMQPFDQKTVFAILLTVVSYAIAYFIGTLFTAWIAILVKAAIFSICMIVGVFVLKLTPDAWQLWEKWQAKLLKKNT
ncbi:MAG: lipopolysaccharide biosynthesis protein [Chitinophagaceae bacterium]